MRKTTRVLAAILSAALLAAFSACGGEDGPVRPAAPAEAAASQPEDAPAEEAEAPEETAPTNYPREAARALLAELVPPEATDRETALLIYNHIIGTTFFTDPVGLDIWRYRSDQTQLPTYEENRSLSPILFQVGSCEDYAAAMVILLQESGIDALYVAGYTRSFRGEYTDHAWVVAGIDGQWYHFDPQLEQNIYAGAGGMIPYRFFMAADSELQGSHLWGEALIRYCGSLATEAEIRRIRSEFSPPPCEEPGPRPEPAEVSAPEKPDLAALVAQIEAERAAHPPLEEIAMNIEAPVLVAAQPLAEV